MKSPTDAEKRVFDAIRDYFGDEQPRIREHVDEGGTARVFVAASRNAPWPGMNSFATVGVARVPLIVDGRELRVRVEIVAGSLGDDMRIEEVLATAAFCVINSGWVPMPGVIFPDVVSVHGFSCELSHVYFASPFVWTRKFPHLVELYDRRILLLHAIPISDGERRFADENGVEALEALLNDSEADTFDLSRTPTL